MKKLVCLLLLLLFVLSSCVYSVNDVNEIEDSWSEKYNSFEAEYDELRYKYNELESVLNRIYEESATVWCYFENEEDISFQEAHEAFDRINDYLQSIY